jgi:hypothetical protein
MKFKHSLKPWRSLLTADTTLLAQIITQIRTAGQFSAGSATQLIPCRVRARTGSTEARSPGSTQHP